MEEKIKVYGKEGCVQCKFTKKLLEDKGADFIYVDTTDDEEKIDYIKNTLGFSSLPVVEYKDITFSGYQPGKVMDLINNVVSDN